MHCMPVRKVFAGRYGAARRSAVFIDGDSRAMQGVQAPQPCRAKRLSPGTSSRRAKGQDSQCPQSAESNCVSCDLSRSAGRRANTVPWASGLGTFSSTVVI